MLKPLINITRKQAFIFAAFLVLYEFLTYIANDMIMPGMIKVVASFNGPESAIATSLTAYVLGGASLQLFLGPISDRYGRRPVMLSGAFFFFICTILIACTDSINSFLLARFFQGMGLCFISVIGYATLQEIFTEMDAIRLIAIMANIAITAPLAGPILGAVIIYYYSWRFIFIAIGILALIALWGLWRFMPEPVGQTKLNGEKINRTSLSPRVVFDNYKKLFKNRAFVLGAMALGFIYLPCMAWIGLSPVMLVKGEGLTIIEYAIWQIPVFGAYILGNVFLHHMTRKRTIKEIIFIGSIIAGISLLITFVLPLYFGGKFIWLMPGLFIYFFAAGTISAPLSRFVLFSTEVSKGTASALLSMISMSIQAIGIELANILYRTQNNQLFGLYCIIVAVVYILLLVSSFVKTKINLPSETNLQDK